VKAAALLIKDNPSALAMPHFRHLDEEATDGFSATS
jgi:hypothetical protein